MLYGAGALAALTITAAIPARAEDRAIVVAVQKYPDQPAGVPALIGCDNDARDMAAFLRQAGFHVTFLLDENATGAAIRRAIADMGKAPPSANDRFLFYFAGKGGRAASPVGAVPALIPVDRDALSRDDLLARIRTIPAAHRFVLLDCGFAAPSVTASTAGRSRCETQNGAALSAAKGLDFGSAQTPVKPDSPVYCVCAAADTQPALENGDGSNAHGIFTRAFLQAVGQSVPRNAPTSWRSLFQQIAKDMATQTYHQRPQFDASELPDTVAFTRERIPEPEKASAPASFGSLAALLGAHQPDSAKITLRVSPEKTTFAIGEPIEVTVQTDASNPVANVVLLEQSADGLIYRLFPAKNDASTARVPPDGTIRLRFAGDTAGTERLIALYLPSEATARRILALLPADRDTGLALANGNVGRFLEGLVKAEEFVNATVEFRVVKP